MEYLIFIGGLVLGIVSTLIYKSRERIHGIIHMDHETEQCIISMSSEELRNPNKKIAVFVINHQAKISQEEQGL